METTVEALLKGTLLCHRAHRTEILRNGLKRQSTRVILQVWSNNSLIISRGESVKVKLTPNIRNNSVHVSATEFCQVLSRFQMYGIDKPPIFQLSQSEALQSVTVFKPFNLQECLLLLRK